MPEFSVFIGYRPFLSVMGKSYNVIAALIQGKNHVKKPAAIDKRTEMIREYFPERKQATMFHVTVKCLYRP